MLNESFELESHKITSAPSSAYYIPNFISEDEEMLLIEHVNNAPKPKWRQLSNRRLQNWGGLPHAKGMIAEKIPNWLDQCLVRLNDYNIFCDKKPNHVLVNEYLPGQGIMPHVDGPLFYPTIATISLGSHTLLDFYNPFDDGDSDTNNVNFSTRYFGSFLLERRSLVVFMDDMYHKYLHGIKEVDTDNFTQGIIFNKNSLGVNLESQVEERSRRISLTIRFFPKVLNVKLKMFKQ